jgi:FkbM family methyltransferase
MAVSNRDKRVMLPSGLPVYGVTRSDARFQHFIGGYFRPEVEIRPGMTVFDVGANIGLFSLEILRRCNGDARLFAFEPATETFAYLERNLRELFPDADVPLQQCALGDHEHDATLYYNPYTSPVSTLCREAQSDARTLIDGFLKEPPEEFQRPYSRWVRRLPRGLTREILQRAGRWSQAQIVETSCRVTTMAAVMRDHAIGHIDFLKVDVEGAELDVLRGIAASDWGKIGALAVEIHDVDRRLEKIRAMVSSAGFEQVIVEQEWPFEGTNVYMLHAVRLSAPESIAR